MYLVACKAQNREGLTHPKCLPHGNTRQGKKRQLKFSCLVICYCDASLAPISFATLYVLRILLASLVIGTFLQLKEMIGKGTKSYALSTSSRISITLGGCSFAINRDMRISAFATRCCHGKIRQWCAYVESENIFKI